MTASKSDTFLPDAAAKFGAGRSPLRVEDERLLSGRGQFLGDQNFPNHLEMVVVRSPHAHADLGTIDLARASSMPGIVGIFTADDLAPMD